MRLIIRAAVKCCFVFIDKYDNSLDSVITRIDSEVILDRFESQNYFESCRLLA